MMVIVDTNVARVANGEWGEDFKNCEETCIDRLERIMRGEMKLVIDADWIILGEYSRNRSSSGKQGTGDRFLTWSLRNQTNPERCVRVPITRIEGSETEFEEFPSDPALKDFHSKDRKFVAVALAHSEKPPILQAVDTKWWGFREALSRHGVTVEFICEADIQRLYEGA